MLPRPSIEAFDSHLGALGLRLEAIVIGGSALALLGVTTRQTRDVDILTPVLPREIAEAAREFARAQRRLGIDLMDDWLNTLCDRGTDLSDCVALAPPRLSSPTLLIWLAEQDTNPGWPAHVKATIADLTQRVAHGV